MEVGEIGLFHGNPDIVEHFLLPCFPLTDPLPLGFGINGEKNGEIVGTLEIGMGAVSAFYHGQRGRRNRYRFCQDHMGAGKRPVGEGLAGG